LPCNVEGKLLEMVQQYTLFLCFEDSSRSYKPLWE